MKSVEFVICEDDTSVTKDTTLASTVNLLQSLLEIFFDLYKVNHRILIFKIQNSDTQSLEYEENFCQKDALLREQCNELECLRSNLKQYVIS